MFNRPTSRVAGRALRRRVEQVQAANLVAAEVDRRFEAIWNRVTWGLQFVRPFGRLMAELTTTFAKLDDLPRFLETALAGAVHAGYEYAAEDAVTAMPKPVFRPTAERVQITPWDVARLYQTLTNLGSKPPKEAVLDLLFPALDKPVVDRIVYATGWKARLTGLTKLATPQLLASTIAQQVAAGRGVNHIARELLPQLSGVKSAARRVARTEYLRVAQSAQFNAYENLGTAVIGYQVHGIMDDRIRPEHRIRNGTVYYKTPTGQQKSMKECPHPPMEANGTLAFNCRCFLAPVFSDEPYGTSGVDIHKTPQFDPATVSAWYDTADEGTRRAAVGSGRYNMVAELVGREPVWTDFLIDGGRVGNKSELLNRHRLAV